MEESVTDLLLNDLSRRLRRKVDPGDQAVALRTFLEAIHLAVGDLLKFDPVVVHIDQWSVWMNRLAKDLGVELTVHSDKYTPLGVIYRQGNIAAHDNKEFTLLTFETCNEHFRQVALRLPMLVRDLQAIHLELEPAVLRRRETAHQLRRAQKLLDALTAAFVQNLRGWEADVWPEVELILQEFDPSALAGLLKNPNAQKRVERAVQVRLSKHGGTDDNCPFRKLAFTLSSKVDLAAWFREDNTLVALIAPEPRRLPIFRVELTVDDIARGGVIDRASWCDLTGTHRAIAASFPIEATSAAGLFRDIKQLFARFSRDTAQSMGHTPVPHEFVLQLAVPRSSAMQGWETLKPDGPRPTLAHEFRAVTIDPTDEYDTLVAMPDLLDASRMMPIWDADLSDLREKGREHFVLLAGPPAWQTHVEGLPAILWNVSQKAGVVLMPESEPLRAIETLKLGDFDRARITWAELLERVAGLQRRPDPPHPAAYRVFMMDARYSTPPAYAT